MGVVVQVNEIRGISHRFHHITRSQPNSMSAVMLAAAVVPDAIYPAPPGTTRTLCGMARTHDGQGAVKIHRISRFDGDP